MPRISTFYGIVIILYYDDHTPPYFHAQYSGHEAQVRIDTLEVHNGSLPRRAQGLVLEWARLHQSELRQAWDNAQRGIAPEKIDPLP
jgi:hypothetical protein